MCAMSVCGKLQPATCADLVFVCQLLAVLRVSGDHPKAGKPLTNMDEPPGGDMDGRRSKTPNGGGKLLEANR